MFPPCLITMHITLCEIITEGFLLQLEKCFSSWTEARQKYNCGWLSDRILYIDSFCRDKAEWMIQHCTLPISPTYQAVHVLVLISTQQPHGLKDGACSLAPPRASISQLEGQRNRAHLCEWTGSLSPRSGHINTLGWYLTTHWHGMITFPMYTARARGCWESCGVSMVTFPRRAWKESTKLQFDPVWNTHALCGVEDPRGPFNACKILSPNDSDWRSLHWRIDLTITPSSYFTKYVKTSPQSTCVH